MSISRTFASMFTGFGGADIGAMAAGLTPVWGIEYDADIAAVANANLGNHITVANVLDCDPRDFASVDVLHASPPCPSFSVANANRGETAQDLNLSRKVAEFVNVLQPRIFTLENVWAYRNSESWQIIEDCLWKLGYWLHVDHVNAADCGVPQTRKRMIVRAMRGAMVPAMPPAAEWVGWYAAIEDLLDTLPESQFAPWQLARLPDCLTTSLVGQSGYDGGIVNADENKPAMTVTANHNQLGVKAFLMQVQGEGGDGIRQTGEPAPTVTTTHTPGKYRAFLMGDQQRQVADVDRPAFTVRAGENGGGTPKALQSNGRIVAMTPRALARFQSFPDWYELPANKTLAARGIGNAVPPLMYQCIVEGLVQ